jgi:hypothetical protein
MNKIRDGWVFSLVHLTWNDPYAVEAWHSLISKRVKNKLQQIQRSFLIFLTKAYRSVSLDALQAIAGKVPIEQAVSFYKDIRANSTGKPINVVIA